MRFPCVIGVSMIGILPIVALATAMSIGPTSAQIASFSVGSDNSTTINPTGQLTTFPDEHVTFMPQKGGGYLVFGSSGGAVELQTQDLVTFNFVNQVMSAPLGFMSCNSDPADNTEFDEN